ncbi:helix-turn-helix domain-containing protein [Arthrobacter sp. NPDC056727]|uniref:helix-turn-helix domain-containing protein n=1 Tax=Arthrobacter sp. NPDC056727 TaxID=3345927 RepID=UPI00366D0FB5
MDTLPPTSTAGKAQVRKFPQSPSTEPDWTELIERLWKERDTLVSDFLERFQAVSYDEALVPEEDIYQTAADSMDMFLLQLAGARLPPDLQALPRAVAVRRARQGVPLNAFLEAVRNDFRVLWKGLERVAREDRMDVLVANMDRLLDTVEGYVSSIQQAFAEEEALLARNKQLYLQRLLTRLFDHANPSDLPDIASALGVRITDTFEVLAVTGDAVTQAVQQYESDRRTFMFEKSGALYLFRVVRKEQTWLRKQPDFSAGYIPKAEGLAAVPKAASSALVLATHLSPGTRLGTMADTWMGVAAEMLEDSLPDFAAPVWNALDKCSPHERQRLLDVALSYGRTGSVKLTSEELYCHRNTVVNRLNALQELIGLDLTVPVQAALALVSIARYEPPAL